jgi:hypothetical protein
MRAWARPTGIVFRPVVLKQEPSVVVPKKEKSVLPEGRLYLRHPKTPSPPSTDRAA